MVEHVCGEKQKQFGVRCILEKDHIVEEDHESQTPSRHKFYGYVGEGEDRTWVSIDWD